MTVNKPRLAYQVMKTQNFKTLSIQSIIAAMGRADRSRARWFPARSGKMPQTVQIQQNVLHSQR